MEEGRGATAPQAPARKGEGAWEERSDDRTHNAPYGGGAGRAAGDVTGGESQAAAGMFAGIKESG